MYFKRFVAGLFFTVCACSNAGLIDKVTIQEEDKKFLKAVGIKTHYTENETEIQKPVIKKTASKGLLYFAEIDYFDYQTLYLCTSAQDVEDFVNEVQKKNGHSISWFCANSSECRVVKKNGALKFEILNEKPLKKHDTF